MPLQTHHPQRHTRLGARIDRSGTARAGLGQGSGTARAQTDGSREENPWKSYESAGGVLADTSRFTMFRARSRTGIVDRAACGGPLAALATSPGERALRPPGRSLAGPAPGRFAAPDGVRRPGGLTAAVKAHKANCSRGGCAAREYPAGRPAGWRTGATRDRCTGA